jgi:hypothetical protein
VDLCDLTIAGGGAEQRFMLSVTRTVATVPDTLFVAPKPARIDVGFLNGTTPKPVGVGVSAHNAGNDPVPLSAPKFVRFATDNGEIEMNAALPSAPTVQAETCAGQLRLRGECAVECDVAQAGPRDPRSPDRGG